MSSQQWDPSSPSPTCPPSHGLSRSLSLAFAQPHQHLPLMNFNSNNNTGFENPFSCYSAIDDPYRPRQPNPTTPRHTFDMPSFRNMDTAALIAAAIGSPERHILRRLPPSPQSLMPARKLIDQPSPSSPLTEISDHDEIEQPDHSSSIKARRASRNKRRRSQNPNADDEYIDDDVQDVVATKRPKTGRSYKPRSRLTEDRDGGAEAATEPTLIPSSTQKTTSGKKRLIRKKPTGTRVPQTIDDAGPADRMMWEWKNMGRGWEDIRTEWQRLTGWRPGQSSLSVRYIKLNENFARSGAAGDQELLRFKREAEEELLSQLWDKVAEKMLIHSPMSEHNPKDLKRRYDLIIRTNFDLAMAAQAGTFAPTKQEDENDKTVEQTVAKPEDHNEVEHTEADQAPDTVLTSCSPAAADTGNMDPFGARYQDIPGEPQYRGAMCGHGDGTAEHDGFYGAAQSHSVSSEEQTWDIRPPARAVRSMSSRLQISTLDHITVPSSPHAHVESSPLFKSLVTYNAESD